MKIVTGDNALTALAVARQCSLIDMSADVLLIDFDVRAKKMSIQRQMADASEIQLMKTAESHTGVHEKKLLDGDTKEPLNKEPMQAPASLSIEMNKLSAVQVAN
jgi:magnesium-transporting ATPase (P-type)